MTQTARLSRRALFTLGIARLAEDLAVETEREPEPAPRPAVDRDDWELRRQGALERRRGLWTPVCAALLDAVGAGDGRRLLCVADGDGDLALAAINGGWDVTACDESEVLVAAGRDRCAAAAAPARWLTADPCALPFEAGSFDGVTSAFGPMFSLDARAAVGELFRVVRAGGTVAFTAWKRGGIVGRLLLLAGEHDPLPQGIPAPITWGREERLRQDLEPFSEQFAFEHREVVLTFDTCREAVERLVGALAPLAAVAHGDALHAAVAECIEAFAGGEHRPLTLCAPYLVVRATVGVQGGLPY